MIMYTRAIAESRKKDLLDSIKSGKLVVFPTELGYYLGANLDDGEAVKRAFTVANKRIRDVCIIPPNVEWINSNLVANKDSKNWVSKLPGAYKLVFKFKEKGKYIEDEKVSIKCPNHWFIEMSREMGVPLLALDVGMNDFYDLDFNIKQTVDFVINDGGIKRPKEVIVDLTGDNQKILQQ